MTIQTGITTNRKALATQISEQLQDAAVTYAGVPSCAYNVGANVSIDRQGAIEVTDDSALMILKPFFIAQGWMDAEPIDEPTDEVEVTDTSDDEIPVTDEPISEGDSKPAPAPDADNVHTFGIEDCRISIPAELTVPQLTNLVHMLYSQQHLLNKAAMDGRLTIPESLITRLTEYTPETPEAFSELLNDFKALDELDGFDYKDGTVHLDFPFVEGQPERWTAYAGLAGRIIHAAKEATRVKAEIQTSENEKYYMRAWLLRLGYGGADLKAERRMLLQNLNGHSAFPNDAAAERHKAKYAAIRHAGQEANAHAE